LCLKSTTGARRDRNRVLAMNDPAYTKGCRVCSAGKKNTGTTISSKSTSAGSAVLGYTACGTDLTIDNCSKGIY